MELLTEEHRRKMFANWEKTYNNGGCGDHAPVVKLFNPCGAGTWLLAELDPENPDFAYGLCDLGYGTPEIGSVYLKELRDYVHPVFKLGIERDIHWEPCKLLSEYAHDARVYGEIRA